MQLLLKRKYIYIVLILLVTIAISAVVLSKDWITTNYYRYKVESTVSSETKPLKSSLEALGFKELDKLKTSCGYIVWGETFLAPNSPTYFDCYSGMDRYYVLPQDEPGKASTMERVRELDAALRSNGWTSRPDYQTVMWFEKILEGVDYQPDQLNTKTVGDLNCIVDFFTAYSKPNPPAVSLSIHCNKPTKL
jgi:hypothetical protein